ncbi:hypothetical protein [Desertivirga xinjiangensis]|uniref:hypothetical protein n=1 Tax=Desertivirga xinjiangensis TaxID=539206 RepID=UPI00210B8DAF|nr:hypothetical protein [Pedobacter xinjiangensis]
MNRNILIFTKSAPRFCISIAIAILNLLLVTSCTDEEQFPAMIIPTRVSFSEAVFYIAKDKAGASEITLTLARPLEKDGSITIQQIDAGTTARAEQFSLDPAFKDGKLKINLPQGTKEASFKLTSLHNFDNDQTIAFKVVAATGGAVLNNEKLETIVTMRGNLYIESTISTSVSTLDDFGVLTINASSASKSYVLSGLNLPGAVTVAAPSHFKVSLDNVNFTSTVSADVNNKNATVYVKFNPALETNLDVVASITHTVTGVANVSVGVSGKIEYTPEVPLLNENFDYGTTSDFLARLTNDWTAYSAAGSIPVTYIPQGLTFNRYAGSNIGGAVKMENGEFSREDVARTFPQKTAGTIYVAVLVNLSKTGTGEFFLATREGGTFFNRVYVKDAGANNLTFGIGKNASVQYATINHKYNTTYLVVAKYDFTSKISSMYVFDGTFPDAEPAAPLAVSLATGLSPASLNDLAIRQAETEVGATIDGLRIATTWRGVLGY